MQFPLGHGPLKSDKFIFLPQSGLRNYSAYIGKVRHLLVYLLVEPEALVPDIANVILSDLMQDACRKCIIYIICIMSPLCK